jgi:phosphoribosylformylglycinamidine synthase
VSFYNEGPRGAIDPTPVIGMVGLIERGSPLTAPFTHEGDGIFVLGETREELGGSEYLARVHRRKRGRPPRVDLVRERALQELMLELAARGFLASAHDCSEGGLAVALAECCLMDESRLLGAAVRLDVRRPRMRTDALLFGESSGRIVASCERYHLEPVEHLAARFKVPAAVIGRVGGSRLVIGPWIDAPVEELSLAWRSGLTAALGVVG